MNVDYDLLTWEGDILRLKFWAQAFEVLKAKGAVYLQHGRPARGLLGDADPGGARQRPRLPNSDGPAPDPAYGARGRCRRGTREGHRPLQRRRDLRRKGHRLPVLEAGPARPGLPVPRVRRAARTVRCGPRVDGRRGRSPAVRRRRLRLQRHRRAAVVPAEAAEAGAHCRRPSGRRRALAPLLLRDGGAVARHGARARLCAVARLGGGQTPVRRGLRAQGARREGRRPARYAHEERRRRSRKAEPGAERGRARAHRPDDRHRGRALLPDQVLARQGDRVRPPGGA